jgi:Arc/MetJ-type ribon-helix-helix transcriptional regulator
VNDKYKYYIRKVYTSFRLVGFMARTETVIVKLKGISVDVLNRLIEMGFFVNKSEAVRAGVIRLGQEYGLVNLAEYYEKLLDEAIRRSGRKPTYEEVMETVRSVRKG